MEDNRPLLRRGAGAMVPVTLSIAMLLLCAPAACPQNEAALPALDADQVVQRLLEKNKERAQGLQHYSGKRSYRLEYRGFPTSAEATMEVEVNFDAPASKRWRGCCRSRWPTAVVPTTSEQSATASATVWYFSALARTSPAPTAERAP